MSLRSNIQRQRMSSLGGDFPTDKMIFADPEVERVLLANMQHEHEDYITKDEFAALTDIDIWFQDNDKIVSFKELYYSGVTMLQIGAFRDSTLEIIDLSNITRIQVHAHFDAFLRCKKLLGITLYYQFNSIGAYTRFFGECESLVYAFLTKGANTTYGTLFDGCNKLEIVDFGEGSQSLTQLFKNTQKALKYFICRSQIPPTIDSLTFPSSITHIFVPSVSTYADAWASYASKIFIIGGPEWVAEFGSADAYADIDKYIADKQEVERIKKAYREA